jgi:hypothetical protein
MAGLISRINRKMTSPLFVVTEILKASGATGSQLDMLNSWGISLCSKTHRRKEAKEIERCRNQALDTLGCPLFWDNYCKLIRHSKALEGNNKIVFKFIKNFQVPMGYTHGLSLERYALQVNTVFYFF